MPARGGTYQGMNWIWGPTRYAIYYRDRDPETGHLRCVWCASRVWVYGEKGRRRACLDHLHPVHLGGNHKQYNLVTSCVPCNNRHGGKHWEDRVATPEALERVRAGTTRPLTADERAEGRKRWKKRPANKKGYASYRPNWRDELAVSPREPGDDDDVEFEQATVTEAFVPF